MTLEAADGMRNCPTVATTSLIQRPMEARGFMLVCSNGKSNIACASTTPAIAPENWAGEYSESLLARQGLAAYAQHPLLRCVSIDRSLLLQIEESARMTDSKSADTVALPYGVFGGAAVRTRSPS